MKKAHPSTQRAILLMREAILLLDEAGEDIAAARLQGAVDTIKSPSSMNSADAMPRDRPQVVYP